MARFHALTRSNASGELMSAAERGSSSEKGTLAASHPGGRTPKRLARSAMKIRAFSSPNPGRPTSRRRNASPSSAPVQTASARPS